MGAAARRYLDHWLRFAKEHQSQWKALEGEFNQLSRAWQMLSTRVQPSLSREERENRVLEFMFAMDRYLENRGLLHENIAWISRALQAAQALQQPVLTGRLGQDLGWCYRELGQLDKALEYLLLALAVRQKFGPREGEANTLNMIGVVYDGKENYQQAREYFEKALAIWIEVRLPERESITRSNLASVYANIGAWDQAEQEYEAALRLLPESSDDAKAAGILNNLGEVFLLRGELGKAESYFRRALTAFQHSGEDIHVSIALNNLALVKQQQGEMAPAIDYMERALHLQQELQLEADAATTLNN